MVSNQDSFTLYSGLQGEDTDLIAIYLQSAENIVSNYLQYNIEETEYTRILYGLGLNHIQLDAYITDVLTLSLNWTELDSSAYYTDGTFLHLSKPSQIFKTTDEIAITYKGGWTSANLPAEIGICVFEIASLKAAEAKSKLSVTSYAFGLDGGSRTYQDTTSFNKFLRQINSYKVFKL